MAVLFGYIPNYTDINIVASFMITNDCTRFYTGPFTLWIYTVCTCNGANMTTFINRPTYWTTWTFTLNIYNR